MPRYVPPNLATVYEQPSQEPFDPVIAAMDRKAETDYLDSLAKARGDVYALDGPHSFFRDLAAVEEARRMSTAPSPSRSQSSGNG